MNKVVPLNLKQLEYCSETISSAIGSFIKASGAKGAVVAVSGGIDSAVVLKLASSVVDVYTLIMPEDGVSNPVDVMDAVDLVNSLNVSYSVIDIKDVVDSFVELFPWIRFSEEKKRMAYANIKPRVRMVFNYILANIDERVVLGTSNRTELLLGYFTKFGDGGCDFEPIGGLYKTQVRQLAEYLGLPESIIKKTPSAGLWVGQTDEEEIGAPYNVIDDVLHLLVDLGYSIEAAAKELNISVDVVSRLNSMLLRSVHKRRMPEVVELRL